MNRREFTTLMCMLPLAFIKPKPRPADQKIHCHVCGIEVATVHWPQRVAKEGTTLCVVHDPDGHGLITDYHFDFYQDSEAQAEIKRQSAEYDEDKVLQKMAQGILDRLKVDDPELFEKLAAARHA